MKKLFLAAIFSIAILGIANAQEVGVRFGNVSGGNVAIDGVFSLGKFSRVHADVSFGNGVGVEALWDIVDKPLGTDGFSWYAGFGPFVRIADPFWLGAVGEIGIEYKFKAAPIAIGVDWRPSLSVIESTNFYADRFGLNIRYVFGRK